jgi:Protein of unknown function (DUF2924)
MPVNIPRELAALQRMTAKELRAKYIEVFGEVTTTGNRSWLLRRIAWRIQAQVEGDLSERARRRAEELAHDANLRSTPPKIKTAAAPPDLIATRTLRFQSGDRLPPPGTVITRSYKGDTQGSSLELRDPLLHQNSWLAFFNLEHASRHATQWRCGTGGSAWSGKCRRRFVRWWKAVHFLAVPGFRRLL